MLFRSIGNVLVRFQPDEAMREIGIEENEIAALAHATYENQMCIRDSVWPDELFVLQQRNKNIIYSGETALYLHEMCIRDSFYVLSVGIF